LSAFTVAWTMLMAFEDIAPQGLLRARAEAAQAAQG
jgi:hypothetical protein